VVYVIVTCSVGDFQHDRIDCRCSTLSRG
jgi:hypothetical protein